MADVRNHADNAAAEDLLKALAIEVTSEHHKQLSTELISLKHSANVKLNTLNHAIVTSREHTDDRLDTLQEAIETLDVKITKQTEEISAQSKQQILAFAVENAHLNGFQYFEEGENKDSADLARSILFSFRKGRGAYLPDDATMEHVFSAKNKDAYDSKMENTKTEFREALVEQIHELTGTNPCIEESDGSYIIYYS